VVVDPVGGDLAEPALRALRPGGRFVTVGYASGAIPRVPLNLALVKDIQIHGLNMRTLATRRPEEFRRTEEHLAELVATGRVVPHICATYPLADAAKALRQVADGLAIGKVVLDLTSTP
jgi:NADPH:quinone reductase